MALKKDKSRYMLFAPVWCVLAGVFSGLCAAAGIVIAVVHLDRLGSVTTADAMVHIAWAVVFAVVMVSVIQMFRGKIGAHQTLLVFWLAIALAGAMIGLNSLLAKTTPQWIQRLDVKYFWMWVTGGSLVGLLAVLLLLKASSQRLRFASVTSVSVTIALGLVVTVNLIAQNDYLRLNAETLGRYTISKRTEKIIGPMEGKLKLTCVYTGTKEGQAGSEYRSRVVELLNDMREHGQKVGKDIEVVNITTDLEKARMVESLKQFMAGRADEHVKYLEGFQKTSQPILSEMKIAKQNFSKPNAYIDQWSLSAELAMSFDQAAKQLDDLCEEVKKSSQGSTVPDYTQLAKKVRDTLTPMSEDIKSLTELLAKISGIPEMVNKNRDEVYSRLQKAQEAVNRLSASLEKPNIINPTETISDYVAEAKLASAALDDASASLQSIAGQELANLLEYSSLWRMKMNISGQTIRPTVVQVLGIFSNAIESHRAAIEKILVDKILAQSQEQIIAKVGELKTATDDLKDMLGKAVVSIQKAIDDLSDVDQDTARMLQSAADEKLFANIVEPIDALVKQGDSLPKVSDSSVATKLIEDNIVLIQTADRTDVVSFEQVWPLAVQPMGMGSTPDEQRRVFNGDSAIGSKILELTHKPFGKVVLAYVAPQIPPQQMMFMQNPPDPRAMFTIIQKKLQQANFEVEEWDISQPLEQKDSQASTQSATQPEAQDENRVILLLPAVGPGGYTQPQVDNLKDQINSGTPAVFLIAANPQRMMDMTPSALDGYLENEWNIKPLKDYLVINAVRDQSDPASFSIDELKLQWSPFNSFTNHPVGKPLQAQRFLLSAMTCPLVVTQSQSPGVTVEPILSTLPSRSDTWATGRLEELLTQFQTRRGSLIKPNYDEEYRADMRCPFDLVLAATRIEDADKNVKPNRIVVMGMAASLADTYLSQQVAVRDSKGTLALADPPALNGDIVVNSVYWLAGLEKRIASGPVIFKPINISDADRITCMMIFAIGLPAIVLAIGGLVMLKRSH